MRLKLKKEGFYVAKKPIHVWNVDVNNIVVSESAHVKKRFKFLIEHLDGVVRPLILIMPKMSGYVKTFDGNKLMSFRVDGDNPVEKYKNIWRKIGELKGFGLTALLIHGDKYIKTKIKTNDQKINADIYDLGVPEDGVDCNCMTIISINFLFIYNKKRYMQVYLDDCVYNTVNKQMTRYRDYDFIESD